MQAQCVSYCKTSRISAGLTQEQAIEQLPIGLRTLAGYESADKVPCDMVVLMSQVYQDKTLLLEHLARCPIGRVLIGELQTHSLQESVLYTRTELADVMELDRDMSLAARDGVISSDEMPLWERIVKEAQDGVKALLNILCVPTGKEKAAGLAHRRL